MIEQELVFDQDKLIKKLKQLEKSSGITLKGLLYDQMRLWCADMVRATVPTGSKKSGKAKKIGWKKQGSEAIKKDLGFLFVGLRPPSLKYIKKGLQDKPRFRIPEGGGFKDVFQYQLISDSSIAGLHKRKQNKRGRVNNKPINSRAYKGKYLVSSSAYNKFVKKQVAKVGTLKAGWVPAWEYFGKRSGQPAKIPAAFAKLKQYGDHRDTLIKSGSGQLVAINKNPQMMQKMTLKSVRIANDKRQNDVDKFLTKRISGMVRNWNAGKRPKVAA